MQSDGNLLSSFDETASDPGLDVAYEPKVLRQLTHPSPPFHQLLHDVKSIYAHLQLKEAKCIALLRPYLTEIQEKQRSGLNPRTHEQWRTLSLYHRMLIQDHHDFYAACQHPGCSSHLIGLIAKNSMPQRMWMHGIQNYLKVLRSNLPDTLEHMMYFMCHAYSMLTVFSETGAVYDWSGRFANLASYFADMEEEEMDGHTWGWYGVVRTWYNRALDKNPNEGSFYYGLGKLSRPNSLHQLCYYVTSLTCLIPFEGAKKDTMDLLTPIMMNKSLSTSFVTIFMKIHGFLFWELFEDELESAQAINDDLLFGHIAKLTAAFRHDGVFVAIICIAGLFGYGSSKLTGAKSIFRLAYEEVETNRVQQTQIASQGPIFNFEDCLIHHLQWLRRVSRFAFRCLSIALRRVGDMNVLSLIHVYLVFLKNLATVEKAMTYVELDVPWTEICVFMNALMRSDFVPSGNFQKGFSDNKTFDALPEDLMIRGQIYGQSYFPDGWFADAAIDDEERRLECSTTTGVRINRILWLAACLASVRLTFLCKFTQYQAKFS